MAKYKNTVNQLILLLILIAAVLGIVLNNNVNLFGDELVVIPQIRYNSLRSLVFNLAYDCHPPLFYLALKIYSEVVGDSIIAIKEFNALCFVLLIFVVFCESRKLFGDKYALITAYTLLLFPCMQNQLISPRMYIFASIWIYLASIYAYFLYIKPSNKNKALFLVFSIFACFSHYYGMLYIGCVHVILYFVFLKQDKKNWKLCVGFALSCMTTFILWLPVFIKQIAVKTDNIKDSTSLMSRFIKSFIFPFYTGTHVLDINYFVYVTSLLLLLLTLFVLLYFVRKLHRNKIQLEVSALVLLLASLVLPVLIMTLLIIVGYITKPLWYGMYITLYFPLMSFGMGYVIWRIGDKRILVCWITVLLVCFIQKSYLQYQMSQDLAIKNYMSLYEKGIIKPNDIIVEAENSTCVYYPMIAQYAKGEHLPTNWNINYYNKIKLVKRYDTILKNKKSFFSRQELTDSIYPAIQNGFALKKKYEFYSKYFDYTTFTLYYYERNDVHLR